MEKSKWKMLVLYVTPKISLSNKTETSNGCINQEKYVLKREIFERNRVKCLSWMSYLVMTTQ